MSDQGTSRLLLDEEPLVVLPSLAAQVGINEAIVIQQIHYWLKHAAKKRDAAHYRDGCWWTYNTYDEWQKQFPWLRARGLRAIFTKLEREGLVIAVRFEKRSGNQRKWYTLDYDRLQQLESPANNDAAENDTSKRHEVPPDVAESDASILTETSTENEKDVPNGTPKEGEPSSPRRKAAKVKKLSEKEASERWQRLTDHATHGDSLKTLAELLAAENKSGEVAITRVWRELGERYLKARERTDLGDGAWAYGFETAIANEAPNIGYVLKAAKNYRPGASRKDPGPAQNGKVDAPTGKTRDDYAWFF